MQPDQPQQPVDPMSPQPAAPPTPAPAPATNPVQPVPPAAPTPVPQPTAAPVDMPVPVAPASTPAAPAQTAPEPATQPTPAPTVSMATPPAASQPQLDSSQPGYVPPANPAPMAPMTGNASNKPSGKFGKMRVVIAIVVALFFLLGGGLLLKDVLFSGSKITKADLVDDTADGISFKRPNNWTKSDDSENEATVFTENGKPSDETDQAMAVLSQSIGVKYESLSESQRQQVFDSIEEGFSKPSSLEDENCKEVVDIKVTKASQSSYTDSVLVEATCNKFTNRTLKAKLKMMIGLKSEDVHIIGISAVDKTWDKSGEALDEILNTFKPAN